MQSDGGAHLVCARNLVSESTPGAHEVRPYGKPFSFAIYARASDSTASFRLSGGCEDGLRWPPARHTRAASGR